ncbi:SPX and EXS domain-containing 1-like isoform X1 [Chlorella sorokiniana]|uniref:SPX and EXS domain-containing 1-like isoform X1 n=1 Tax=Chlorella sorokiniana TaxID=3076 RepID=A0A2P6U091_CHLSO|nr:SPX and EXS domain-containing 1-like isoform X1 [Chlorella sorokiniana]|eukprot:PRW59731.1 SPX and EXS domain-containing 1-like isoform X1 [Chlorella sorokiniana]
MLSLSAAEKQALPSSPSRGLRGSEEGSAPRHLRTQASGVPAAALLSSPEALRAAGWGALHAVLGLGTAKYWSHLNKTQRDLYFLYYQPFLPMLAMLWLWGTAVRFWERRRIRYDVCFLSEDQRYLLRSGQLFQIANVLSSIVLSSGLAFVYLLAYGLPHLAAYLPGALYCSLLALFLFPGNLLERDSRLFFGRTLWRIVTPLRSVTWADFLLADVLTSLAKALSDTERAVCHLMTGFVMVPQIKACSDASYIIPLGLAAPYAWRLVQCIRVYLDTGARPQLFNALKYSTAFPVIALSAVKYHVSQAAWRGFYKPLWLGAALLNSAYSFFWDVERDWEISFFTQLGQQRGALLPSPVLRSTALFRRPFYLYLMASNLVLRLGWLYRLSPHLRHHHAVVTLMVLVEAFRRFQWLFVRIEVELRKIQAQRPEVGVLVPAAPPAYPVHPMDAAAHAHAGGSDRGGGADSGSEEEGGGGPRHGGIAAPRGREKKASAGARMLPLVDLNPLPR